MGVRSEREREREGGSEGVRVEGNGSGNLSLSRNRSLSLVDRNPKRVSCLGNRNDRILLRVTPCNPWSKIRGIPFAFIRVMSDVALLGTRGTELAGSARSEFLQVGRVAGAVN